MDTRPADMYGKIVELIDRGTPLAAAVVLSTSGSTPQQPGARAVIEPSGRIWGTVGGGAVEAEACRVAVVACRSGVASVLDFALDGADAAEQGAICGGRMQVLVDPTVARHRECFAHASETLAARRRGCLRTTIRTAPSVQVQIEWVADNGPSSAFDGRVTLSSVEGGLLFVEPVVPSPLVIVAGGGHVGQAAAELAVRVGFEVTVIDDRPEFAAAALFPPGVKVVCGPVAEWLTASPLDGDTYVVLVTRGHRHDAEALAACICRPSAYLGMIGSRRKVAMLREHFLESGLASAEEFERVRAPIGLAIGAVTVPEIAVSIVAQLIAVRRGAAAS